MAVVLHVKRGLTYFKVLLSSNLYQVKSVNQLRGLAKTVFNIKHVNIHVRQKMHVMQELIDPIVTKSK